MYIYINFIFLLSFLYLCDKLYIGHVISYVTWLMYISIAFLFGFPSSLFFPSFLFLTCSSSGMPAIASGYLMCGFLNHAVPLYIVTAAAFIEYYIPYHGFPKAIISNKGT